MKANVHQVHHLALLLGLWCWSLPTLSWAEQFCFLMAENYYEQLYCEVKAKGHGGSLPAFYDFRKNEPLTQALILKRPAANLGVDVSMPKKSVATLQPVLDTAPPQPVTQSTQAVALGQAVRTMGTHGGNALLACSLKGVSIECGAEKYQLMGNKSNHHLAEDALDVNNQLAIQAYIPQQHSGGSLDAYLLTAYQRYITKMLEIGLGAATLSYPKFSYLFDDMVSNGVDFSGRFEIMYSFLKKDKLHISVSESIPTDVNVSLENCMLLGSDIIACSSDTKNYLYVSVVKGA